MAVSICQEVHEGKRDSPDRRLDRVNLCEIIRAQPRFAPQQYIAFDLRHSRDESIMPRVTDACAGCRVR